MTTWEISHYNPYMSMNLIKDIDTFLALTAMGEGTLGLKAVNDGKFVKRLRTGSRCWPETEQRVRAFMRSYKRKFNKTIQ